MPLSRRGRSVRNVLALTLVSVTLAGGCRSAVELADREATGADIANCVDGGTLVAAVAQAPVPGRVLAGSAANVMWVRGVFEPLLAVGPDGPVELLATGYTISADDRTAVLRLREGVRFHTGRAFTAQDVLYTVARALEPSSPSSVKAVLSRWDVRATGDHEITITSPAPLTPVLASVLDNTPILDRETAAGLDDGSALVGTGPFRVDRFRPGAEVSLVRNDDYWQTGLPRLDRIDNVVVPDTTAQIAAMRSGRTQLAYGMTTQDADTLARSGRMELGSTQNILYALVLDPRGPLADVRVRQAIGHAIDRERIVAQVFAGQGAPDAEPWPTAGDAPAPGSVPPPGWDPDRARELVREAGAEGAAVPVTIINNPQLQATYQILANNLTEIGLRPSLVALTAPDYQSRLAAGDGGNYLSFRAQSETASLLVQTNPDYRLRGAHRPVTPPGYAPLVDAVVAAGAGPAAGPALGRLSDRILDDAVVQNLVVVPGPVVRSLDVQAATFGPSGLLSRETCMTR